MRNDKAAAALGGGQAGGYAPAVFRTITAAIAVETVVFSLIIPALPVFSNRYGLSDSVASLIFAAFPVLQFFTAIAIAERADGMGRRVLLVSGCVLLLVSTLGFAFADTPFLLVLARGVQGIGAGMIWVAGVAAISDTYPQNELGFRLGMVETAGGGIGLLGPLIGGPLIVAIGIEGTFLVAAALAAVLVVAVRSLPETRVGELEALALLPTFGALLRQKSAKVGSLSLALVGLVLAIVEPLLALDLEHRLGASSAGVGLVFGTGLVAFLVATPIAGRWSDRHGRGAPILVGSLVVSIGLPFLGFGSLVTVSAAFVLVAVGLAVMASSSGPLLMGAVDQAGFQGHYGFSAAILTAIFSLGYAAGPLLGAVARVILPFSTLLLLISATLLLGAVFFKRSGAV